MERTTRALAALTLGLGALASADPPAEDLQKHVDAPLALSEAKLEYPGPNSPTIEFFLSDDPYVLPKIGGETLDLDLECNYKSPFIENKVGSDVVTARYGKRRWDYGIGKNTVAEVKQAPKGRSLPRTTEWNEW